MTEGQANKSAKKDEKYITEVIHSKFKIKDRIGVTLREL